MKKIILTALALCSISSFAHAQLAGTDRVTSNQWIVSDRAIKFGDYPNAEIKYDGTNLLIDILHGGGKVSIPDGMILGPSSFGASIEFEGTTSDAFETTLGVVDPTADRTVSIPNQSGTVLLSQTAQDAAESIKGISNGIQFEGSTADSIETNLIAADPTGADTTYMLNSQGGIGAVVLSTLSTNAADVAGSVWLAANAIKFEGATANGNETTVSVTDPTASRTVTIPDASGTICLGGALSLAAGANTACSTTCGALTKCLFGEDTAANHIVDCADATADTCICTN